MIPGVRLAYDEWGGQRRSPRGPDYGRDGYVADEDVARDMNESRRQLHGDHWADWVDGWQPALLMRGGESDFLTAAMAREMAARRPGTRLVEFPGAGHGIHDDDREGFTLAVASFLAEL